MRVSRAGNKSCFLCRPAPDLVYCDGADGTALTGLGPLTDGYSVVGSKEHVRSAADSLKNGDANFLQFAVRIREFLTKRYGSCLVTEHGRVPVCDGRRSDEHCFHAHFLMFPASPQVLEQARPYFAKTQDFGSLDSALRAAASVREYFLISPDPSLVSIMTRPTALIRQFSRMLVADALGQPALANWRRHDRRDIAVGNAALLKRELT